MNRDEARKILGENATEEQVTNLLNSVHNFGKAKDDEIAKLKEETAKYSDYDSIKGQLDEINRAKMTEQEKLEAEKKQAAENLKNSKIIYNTAKVKEILAGENVAEDLIKNLVSDDENISIANANALKNTLSSLRETVEKTTKENLINQDINPDITDVNLNNNTMNFEKFSNLSSEEQIKFMEEHPEEFKNLQ